MKAQFIILFACCLLKAGAQPNKHSAIQSIRSLYAEKPYRSISVSADSVSLYKSLLSQEGLFTDLANEESEIAKGNYAEKVEKQTYISAVTKKAFNRLWMMAETYRGKQLQTADPILGSILRAICHYGSLEHNRINVSARWHVSCFTVPVASTHIYFSLFDLMNRIESGEVTGTLFADSHKALADLSYQCWTVPARFDETDKNVVSVDRFRKHVWWVGGNATGYRSLLQTAAQLSSCEMTDVVGEIAVRSISSVSQTTYDDDFWTEGITADGAGWGHGMQCLVWGYPIDGTVGSLRILEDLKNYPLPISLSEEQINTLMDYIRGSSFYYYKGYVPPVVDRGNMNRLEAPYPGRIGDKETDYRYLIPSMRIVKMLLDNFSSKLTPAVKEELQQFVNEAPEFRIRMSGNWNSYYSGSRYFFNNDDIIRKTDNYYLLVNMASNRVSGLESARTMAASLNIFTCDGSTLFFRKGDEYQRILGACNLRAWPGTTSRLLSTPLNPIENWNGYNSLHAFAACATSGSGSFAGGFIFEKNNREWQQNNKPHDPLKDPNPSAFGVKANKSYFMFDDLFLALGSGIENKMPDTEGSIITTIDQTGIQPDFKSDDTVLNNGFYYEVLNKHTQGILVLDTIKRKTHWQDMCIENKLPETDANLLHLYIDHGLNPQKASYAYTVCCTKEALLQRPVILSNTEKTQAAESFNACKIGAVFYVPDVAVESSKGYIKPSAPCALLFEYNKNEWLLSVTDGRMDASLKEITIETSIPMKGENVETVSDGIYKISVPLKGGRYTGSPVSIRLQTPVSDKIQ